MATHELPNWEGPAAPKRSLFHIPISVSPIDKAKSLFNRGGRDRSSFHAFDKEVAVEAAPDPPATKTPDRKYCGLGPRIWLFIVIASILLLALIIGLSVGLSHKSSSKPQNLPLPTNAGIFTGDLTYYSPGPGYGACGYENTSSQAICAVSHLMWDAVEISSNPNDNPLCGKRIRITRFDPRVNENRSVDVEVVDRCEGCQPTDLDLSIDMFTSLADEGLGRVLGTWAWLP